MSIDPVKEVYSKRKESLIPKIDDDANSDTESSKTKLLRLLDDIENRVERFRRGALHMEEEKDILFSSIDAIKSSDLINELLENEKEEIFHYTERITTRCNTVEISVRTVRNTMQEESLNQVNTLIDNLVIDLHTDPFVVKERCLSFMAACVSKTDDLVDKNFESVVLGCTLDDQKRIRRRLQGLLSYVDYSFKVSDLKDCD